jgi:hypothetical protein
MVERTPDLEIDLLPGCYLLTLTDFEDREGGEPIVKPFRRLDDFLAFLEREIRLRERIDESRHGGYGPLGEGRAVEPPKPPKARRADAHSEK